MSSTRSSSSTPFSLSSKPPSLFGPPISTVSPKKEEQPPKTKSDADTLSKEKKSDARYTKEQRMEGRSIIAAWPDSSDTPPPPTKSATQFKTYRFSSVTDREIIPEPTNELTKKAHETQWKDPEVFVYNGNKSQPEAEVADPVISRSVAEVNAEQIIARYKLAQREENHDDEDDDDDDDDDYDYRSGVYLYSDSGGNLEPVKGLFELPCSDGLIDQFRAGVKENVLKQLRGMLKEEPTTEIVLEIARSIDLLRLLGASNPALDKIGKRAREGAMLYNEGMGKMSQGQELLRSVMDKIPSL